MDSDDFNHTCKYTHPKELQAPRFWKLGSDRPVTIAGPCDTWKQTVGRCCFLFDSTDVLPGCLFMGFIVGRGRWGWPFLLSFVHVSTGGVLTKSVGCAALTGAPFFFLLRQWGISVLVRFKIYG
jgi:hypothetical protein